MSRIVRAFFATFTRFRSVKNTFGTPVILGADGRHQTYVQYLRQIRTIQPKRVYPYPLRGVCETKSKNGHSRPRKPFISRVFCAQRGLETMVSEGARPWGRDRSGNSEQCETFHILSSLGAEMLGGVPTTPDPNTSAKVSHFKWQVHCDTIWWCRF